MTGELRSQRRRLLEEFSAAYNRHDVDAVMSCFTPEVEFVSFAGPYPHGERFVGTEAVRARVAAFLDAVPDARWTDARHSVDGDRGFSEWTYMGTERGGTSVQRDGIDVFAFTGILISSKSTYQKQVTIPAKKRDGAMIKVALSYPRVDGLDFDADYYLNRHAPFATEVFTRLGMMRAELNLAERQVRADQPDVYAVTTQYWPSLEVAEAAFAAEDVQRVREDAHHFYAAPATVRFYRFIEPET